MGFGKGRGLSRPKKRKGTYTPGTGKRPQRTPTPAEQGSVVVSEYERRVAIKALWVAAGRPAEGDWGGRDGTVAWIMSTLCPRVLTQRCGPELVREVLRRCAVAESKSEDYDCQRKAGSGGHNRKMDVANCLTDDAMAIGMAALNKGFSFSIATGRVNTKLRALGRKEITEKVLVRLVGELGGEIAAVGNVQQGSRDKESNWAQCSLALARQLEEQFANDEKRTSARRRRPTEGAEEQQNFPPVGLDQIAFFDQHHAKCQIGAGAHSKVQVRIPVNADGRPCPVEQGGVMPPVRSKRKLKFPPEVRVDAGVAAPTVIVGGRRRRVARRTSKLSDDVDALFDYGGPSGTGKLLGPKEYMKNFWAEVRRVRGKQGGWAPFSHEENPYLARWPEDWEARVKQTTAMKKFTDVRDLMTWRKAQGDAMFAGSTHANDWVCWSDGLSQWWEKEAQEHWNVTLGMAGRQICSLAPTNVGTIYAGKLPGDRPQWMPLDDCLFNDFKRSRAEHIAATFDLAADHAEKFSMANPTLGPSTFLRVWEVAPTDARIIQDIDRVRRSNQRVIEAEGGVVEGVKRNGGRAARCRLPPLHPHAEAALQASEAKFGGL